MVFHRDWIRLILPRNFSFLKRLPERFEAKIIAFANETAKGKWYEVEIKGQKLHLLSQINLPIGKEVVLEKISDRNLRFVESRAEITLRDDKALQDATTLANHFFERPVSGFSDFLHAIFIQDWLEQKGILEKMRNPSTYRFIHPKKPQLRGIFYQKHDKWLLFLPETIFGEKDISSLRNWLMDLGIREIFLVSDEKLEQIKGIDIWL